MKETFTWNADSWGADCVPNGYEKICEAANELILRSNNPTEFSNALWDLCCQYDVLFDEEDEEEFKLEKTDTKITRYVYGNWRVDIIECDNGYNEAYLSHERYGVSSLMFGSERKYCEENGIDFIELVEGNMKGYIDFYKEEYFDDLEEAE